MLLRCNLLCLSWLILDWIRGNSRSLLICLIEFFICASDVLLQDFEHRWEGVEQKLEFVQIYVFREDSEAAQVRSHEDAEAVFRHDWFIKNFLLRVGAWWRVRFRLFGALSANVAAAVLLIILGLVIFQFPLGMRDSFQVHVFSLKQLQNRLRRLRLTHFI